MNTDAYIEISDLLVAYPDRMSENGTLLLIDHLKLTIAKGSFVSIVGPNGCGKTTLLLCLAGILKPTSGTIKIAGVLPEKSMCGYVFQNYRESLFPWLTILDNIAMPLWLNGTPKNKARQIAFDLMNQLKLNLPVERFPYTLSGGQQQLTALLRAVIHKPDVLLLDEPFGSLDEPSRVVLRDSLQQIWQTIGATTVFVSHDLDEAILAADTVVAFTQRPAHVSDILQVSLPRPRTQEMIHENNIETWREHIHKVMAGEQYL